MPQSTWGLLRWYALNCNDDRRILQFQVYVSLGTSLISPTHNHFYINTNICCIICLIQSVKWILSNAHLDISSSSIWTFKNFNTGTLWACLIKVINVPVQMNCFVFHKAFACSITGTLYIYQAFACSITGIFCINH